MTRRILIAAAVMFAGGLVWAADDPPAPQPKRGERAAQPKSAPAQPPRFADQLAPFRAGTVARYEEEVETLEANLETKKAYLRAAEVGVKGPKIELDQTVKLATGANPTVSQLEVGLYKAKFEAAEAQVQIRQAELKEVEVRLKHAKKRLADAKNPPARPARPDNPNANPFRRGERPADRKPVDPQQ